MDSTTYYSSHGPVTSPWSPAATGLGPEAGSTADRQAAPVPGIMSELDRLPTSPAELARTIQGLLVHIVWAGRYGLGLTEERERELNLRWFGRQLARLKELDPAPLATPRPLESRLVGNCRDFTLFFCAILRQHGLPARARCGFATYFRPGYFEDHWVGEYYDPGQQRWVMVDAQLDGFQRQALHLDFDPLDVPPDRFIAGGRAWRMCREEGHDPERFGISIPGGPDMHGLWFVRGDLVRDFLALNKVEILPWDPWGLMADEEGEPTDDSPGGDAASNSDAPPADAATLDHLAVLTLDPDANFEEIRRLFATDPRLATPPGWWPAGLPLTAER